ncbi:hypothetical protein QYS49_00055 [Marivirga salinae]|uniref:Uncharacterized protein n=1 Tax=Marivirga salinarum TaxID=3059078 RepID=A0AA49GB12_9BACT|nr:hypothetical protein [Marivirga sp. BDSF4-3]WKK75912.1 hypothetical protein QYS49_00055 [Marivirga sp. BDSF4-3]
MRYSVKLSGIAVMLLVLITACEKEEINEANPPVDGIYEGTLSSSQSKTAGAAETSSATAEITISGENEIRVHCYSDSFDSTFVMNYYHHNDSVYVCLTGDDFEEMYGHKLGGGHHGGMMDDIHKGETEWMHHMSEEHDDSDEHFGGFDMTNHSFSYTFKMNMSDSSEDLHFQGTKQ